MRKYTDRKFLAATLFIASTFSCSLFAAPRSYPMSCRGGAGTLGLTTNNNSAVFYFLKASGPAGVGLQPGQCAWLDRAIGSGEPPCIQQYNTNGTAWIFPDRKQDSYFSSATGEHWLRDLLSSSKYVTFQAYNPGTGACFVITRVGA
jgi:hypothetical protein